MRSSRRDDDFWLSISRSMCRDLAKHYVWWLVKLTACQLRKSALEAARLILATITLYAISALSSEAMAVNAPTINPGYGVFSSSQNITMSVVGGGTIYYTLDGSTPTTGSTPYTA